jgi:hypothetical protein
MFAVVQDAHGLAHLRNAAPQSDVSIADVTFANDFVFGAKKPREKCHQAKQRYRHQQLALHSTAPNLIANPSAIVLFDCNRFPTAARAGEPTNYFVCYNSVRYCN